MIFKCAASVVHLYMYLVISFKTVVLRNGCKSMQLCTVDLIFHSEIAVEPYSNAAINSVFWFFLKKKKALEVSIFKVNFTFRRT